MNSLVTLARVAISPGEGMLWVAKESGILEKHGIRADQLSLRLEEYRKKLRLEPYPDEEALH